MNEENLIMGTGSCDDHQPVARSNRSERSGGFCYA